MTSGSLTGHTDKSDAHCRSLNTKPNSSLFIPVGPKIPEASGPPKKQTFLGPRAKPNFYLHGTGASLTSGRSGHRDRPFRHG